MALWNEKLNNSKGKTTPQKDIDWEERHFQICLAMLSCPVCNRHGHPDAPMLRDVVAQANKMVELLKKNAEKMSDHHESEVNQTEEVKECQIEAKQDRKRGVPQKGLWRPGLERGKLYADLWKALKEHGYDKGSDIPYFHFNECCEELNIDVDSIDIEKFSERYEVNIG